MQTRFEKGQNLKMTHKPSARLITTTHCPEVGTMMSGEDVRNRRSGVGRRQSYDEKGLFKQRFSDRGPYAFN